MKKLGEFIEEAFQKESTHGYEAALNCLELAHVISQKSAFEHFYVHWLMLRLALRHKVKNEIRGQLPRILLAIPGSLFGLAPEGNIGSTKMGIFEKRKKTKR